MHQEMLDSDKPPVDPEHLKEWKAQREFHYLMDTVLLNANAMDTKNKLLEFVDQIVIRQNQAHQPANHENFVVENSSRKVLRELLTEFNTTAVDLKDKMSSNDDKIRLNKG